MLVELGDALVHELPTLLMQPEKWDSLIINRRKPYTYRAHTQLASGLRCCLHKFDPCHEHEADAHPHPWEGAFIILEGMYKMWVGYSPDRVAKPDSVMTLVLGKHSQYEIVNPMTWHSVIPLTTTYTVMVNGNPWAAEYAHQDVKRTKGKDLAKMPEDELRDHLQKFRDLLMEWHHS